jgi:hypothetical protein
LQSENEEITITRSNSNEKDISAIEQEKEKQTRFQGKNVDRQRPESVESPPCQRKKKAVSVG